MSANQNGQLAIDIETVSPHLPASQKPDFENPNDFELLCVGTGYRPSPESDVEVAVHFRAGTSPESEAEVIGSAIQWCLDREASTLITYNGDGFDFPIMRGRARRAGDACGQAGRLRSIFERLDAAVEHDDIKRECWEAFGEYTTLEDSFVAAGVDVTPAFWNDYDHGIDPDSFRIPRYQGKREVTSFDIAQFGERYLTAVRDGDESRDVQELRAMIDAYTRGDVEPLFELADRRPFV